MALRAWEPMHARFVGTPLTEMRFVSAFRVRRWERVAVAGMFLTRAVRRGSTVCQLLYGVRLPGGFDAEG